MRSKETFQITRARSVDVDAYAHASARNDRERRVEWLDSSIRARLAHALTGEADTGARRWREIKCPLKRRLERLGRERRVHEVLL